MQAEIRPQVMAVKGGHILYDAAQGGQVHEHIFAPAYWRTRDALGEALGGRGSAWRIHVDDVDWVLRYYRRGGLPGKFIHDWYFYTGIESTRAWREWRLLAHMFESGLPVPRPVAARVQRGMLGYRAAIITTTVPGDSFASLIISAQVNDNVWRGIGRTIRRVHDAGVWHADLNAHNIMVNDAQLPDIYLLDFDRGRLRSQDTAWREANLARLRRSLQKLVPHEDRADEISKGFARLLEAYAGE